jgi:3-hydroxybutyryl-CoA dehydrogenase
MTTYAITRAGESRSFPAAHAFTDQADPKGASRIFIGTDAGKAFRDAGELGACPFVAIELGSECLGVHTGESGGHEGSNVVGFARFRLGRADPTALIELVRQPATRDGALQAARAAFEAAGLKVAVCGDFPGRIVDRLIRPYLNAALRRLDEKLASAEDMDKTLCLGLG